MVNAQKHNKFLKEIKYNNSIQKQVTTKSILLKVHLTVRELLTQIKILRIDRNLKIMKLLLMVKVIN